MTGFGRERGKERKNKTVDKWTDQPANGRKKDEKLKKRSKRRRIKVRRVMMAEVQGGDLVRPSGALCFWLVWTLCTMNWGTKSGQKLKRPETIWNGIGWAEAKRKNRLEKSEWRNSVENESVQKLKKRFEAKMGHNLSVRSDGKRTFFKWVEEKWELTRYSVIGPPFFPRSRDEWNHKNNRQKKQGPVTLTF